MKLSTTIAILSLSLSAGSTIWIGGFRFSTVIHKVDALGTRIDKLEDRMEKRFEKIDNELKEIRNDIHKIDVRVSVLEQSRQ